MIHPSDRQTDGRAIAYTRYSIMLSLVNDPRPIVNISSSGIHVSHQRICLSVTYLTYLLFTQYFIAVESCSYLWEANISKTAGVAI